MASARPGLLVSAVRWHAENDNNDFDWAWTAAQKHAGRGHKELAPAWYEEWDHLLNRVRNIKIAAQARRQLETVPFLAVDEIDAGGSLTPWAETVLRRLLDARINMSRPTMLACNASVGELYARVSERVADRVADKTNFTRVTWRSKSLRPKDEG